jgi:hypothetical protein
LYYISSGDDARVTIAQDPKYFSEAAQSKAVKEGKPEDYVCILLDKLYKQTFHSVLLDELNDWLFATSKEQEADPDHNG